LDSCAETSAINTKNKSEINMSILRLVAFIASSLLHWICSLPLLRSVDRRCQGACRIGARKSDIELVFRSTFDHVGQLHYQRSSFDPRKQGRMLARMQPPILSNQHLART
jgi:hypothetical protein